MFDKDYLTEDELKKIKEMEQDTISSSLIDKALLLKKLLKKKNIDIDEEELLDIVKQYELCETTK